MARKGTPFEKNCEASLRQIFPDAKRTHEEGYFLMYDLESKNGKFIGECKRLRGISWNQAVKFYEKTESLAPTGYKSYLFFQSNFQPCLVMSRQDEGYIQVVRFEVEFGTEFIKYTPVKRNKLVIKNE